MLLQLTRYINYLLTYLLTSSKTKPCQFGSVQLRRSVLALTASAAVGAACVVRTGRVAAIG